MTKRSIFPTFFFFLLCGITFAQKVTVPFDTDHWNLDKAETSVETYMGKNSLLLQKGAIYLKDVQFLNGTIEVDVNFPAGRNFPGIQFRGQDEQNYESFYIRPHQSGNPDACQYTPVFNGFAAWQLYHGEGYGTAINLEPDQWHHIRIEIKGDEADVYYNDMDKAVLHINRLQANFPAGFLALNSGNGVHFANFTYYKDATTYPAKPVGKPDGQTIAKWELSQVVDNALFADKTWIESSLSNSMQWTSHATEASGLLNIARHTKAEEGKTTVVARMRITSDSDQIKGLAFGYSDEVKVFVNGKLQYGGSTAFRSRDYRYLGTIGYFDAVFLDLKKGENEIWFAVKENFGGWGLQARYL